MEKTTTSVTLSVTGVGLIVVPTSAGRPCALSLGIEVIDEIILNNYKRHKNIMEKTCREY